VARLTAKQKTGIASLARYITAHGPFMARLQWWTGKNPGGPGRQIG